MYSNINWGLFRNDFKKKISEALFKLLFNLMLVIMGVLLITKVIF